MPEYYCSATGLLKFSGRDRLDLINRLSTNDINTLKKLGILKTVITNEKGRIIDLITLLCFDDHILALVSEVYRKKLIDHLQKYTVMDDFLCEDLSEDYKIIFIFGSFSDHIPETGNHDSKDNSFIETDKYILTQRPDDILNNYIMIYQKSQENKISEILNNFKELSEKEYEAIRIQYGSPAAGKEISEEINPLECGLKKYVSFTKGCYIGQEVIARLDSYDKISRHLIGIKSSEPFTTGSLLKKGHLCGFATSYAYSNIYGHIGLGFVKTSFIDFNADYTIMTSSSEIPCRINQLPFN